MGDGSPLFHSALDLLAHASEHYVGTEERDRKLVILHLANSIELLLKDRLLDLGISIYESQKQTKTITRVFADLEKQNVLVPQKHIIELLIDERNNIQHRFGSPNSLMVKYYFDNSLKFFEEFMNSAFGLELREYLSNLVDMHIMQFIYPESESSKDVLLQARLVARVHPSSSIVTAWMEIEKKVDELRVVLEKAEKKTDVWINYPVSSFFRKLLMEFPLSTRDTERLRHELVSLSVMRNQVVHADKEATSIDAQGYIERVEHLLPEIDRFKNVILNEIKSQEKTVRKTKNKHANKT